MNLSENSTDPDLRDALLQLSEQVERLDQKLDKLIESVTRKHDLTLKRTVSDFERKQSSIKSDFKLANLFLAAAVIVSVLSSFSPAISEVIKILTAK